MKSDQIQNNIIIGIDLGTTNSEIAINIDGTFEVIVNSIGDLYTPSVFGVNRNLREVVGKAAYQTLYNNPTKEDFLNYKGEIKRLMGKNEKIKFPRSNKEYTPEEISAEILKSLKSDLLRRYPNISTIAAVITVPASFDTVQNEATKRAAILAGFEYVSLLAEPIAAAVAYGHSNDKEDTWIVYDLGGGTFDAALMTSKNGLLRVINHFGDNFKGGKDIDNLIIDHVIKPQILKKFSFKDFNINNPKYLSAFATLKGIAEKSKIDLSTQKTIDIEIRAREIDLIDDKGNEVDLYFTYTRAEFEKLIDGFVSETIELTNKTIETAGINKNEISKIIFVGAATQTPYIKEKIEKEIGIAVDTSLNPFTVVAKGAAIYGLTQKIPEEILGKHRKSKTLDEVKIELNYDMTTNDEDQLITGIVHQKNADNYYIKISSDSGFYNSDKIAIKNGKFNADVALERGKTNLFWLYLLDSKGNVVPTYPDSFTITHGLSILGAPIPHTIGVVYAKQSYENETGWVNTCDPYFDKSSIPPIEETKTFKTVRELKKGEKALLPIIVYEGDSMVPEHNQVLSRLGIDGEKLPYNLPKGTEIDIKISIKESRVCEIEVYIPLIDVVLNARVDVYRAEVDTKKIEQELKKQEDELKTIKGQISDKDSTRLSNKIKSTSETLKNHNDTDTKQKADKELKEIQSEINHLKEETKIERAIQTYEKSLSDLRDVIEEITDKTVKSELQSAVNTVQSEAREAIKNNDEKALSRVISIIGDLKFDALKSTPKFWIGMYFMLEDDLSIYSDRNKAISLLDKGKKAIDRSDLEGLKDIVIELISLVKREAQDKLPIDLVGVTK